MDSERGKNVLSRHRDLKRGTEYEDDDWKRRDLWFWACISLFGKQELDSGGFNLILRPPPPPQLAPCEPIPGSKFNSWQWKRLAHQVGRNAWTSRTCQNRHASVKWWAFGSQDVTSRPLLVFAVVLSGRIHLVRDVEGITQKKVFCCSVRPNQSSCMKCLLSGWNGQMGSSNPTS